jgi:hypothetical protein
MQDSDLAEGDRTDEENAHLARFLVIADALERSNALLVGGALAQALRQRLEQIEPGTPEEMSLRFLYGRELLRLGDNAEALRQFQAALRVEHAAEGEETPEPFEVPEAALEKRESVLRRLRFKLVIASMRIGEQANCVALHNPEVCLLPIRGGGVHVDRAGAEAALEYGLDYLSRYPDDLKGIWFLNLAAMQAGVYPDGLPRQYLIPPERFTSKADVGRYVNIAAALEIDTFNEAGGSMAEDFDGDGLLDLVTSTMDPRGPLTYFHNDGDGTFSDWTRPARLDSQLGGLNAVHTDYNNDGRPDLFVLRGGWLQDHGRVRNSLLRNNPDNTFTDVTREAGLADPAYPTQAGGWADYDGDGDLDLYIGNEGQRRGQGMTFFPENLYRNNGDGTFTDVAREAGVANDRYAKGVAWGDYDNDGDPDLYVSNIGENRLYRNDGDGTFTDVAPRLGVTEPRGRSFATWFFDYDNDGDLDIFVVAYSAQIEDIAADVMGISNGRPELWPRLYRNDGGRFTDVTVAAGLNHPSLPMGTNFGDLNEDGHLDIYLGTGAPPYEAFMPNLMYLNNGDGTFTDITFSGGFGHLQKGHGVSFADFDSDGDADIHLQAGGMFPGDLFNNVLFENPGHGHRFLSVKAIGTRSNRAAIGTRIHVRVAAPGGERSVYRWVGTGGSFGASPLEQLIGLGNATRILSLELSWPASGTSQRFSDVPLDSSITVVEGEEHFQTAVRQPFRFATSSGHRH